MDIRPHPARATVAALLIALLAACAGSPERAPRAEPQAASELSADDVASDAIATDGHRPGEIAADAARADASVAASSDATAAPAAAEPAPLSPEQLDPWEPFNRRMHAFNRGFDHAFLRPVARGYVKVVPSVLRRGVSNFFNNLYQPISAANFLLQGEPGAAGAAGGRFLLNLTLGLGGILDPATHAGIPYADNDFGQTLAHWGWEPSRYLVLPLFGPATVRDSLGKGVSTLASPVGWLAEDTGPGLSLLYGVDARAGGLAAEAFLENVEDEYLLVRDAYLQRRHCQLVDCSSELPEYLLPDYEVELPDFEWRR